MIYLTLLLALLVLPFTIGCKPVGIELGDEIDAPLGCERLRAENPDADC
jgi:hypothetical protein